MKVNLGNDREIAAVCMRQIEGGNATGLVFMFTLKHTVHNDTVEI